MMKILLAFLALSLPVVGYSKCSSIKGISSLKHSSRLTYILDSVETMSYRLVVTKNCLSEFQAIFPITSFAEVKEKVIMTASKKDDLTGKTESIKLEFSFGKFEQGKESYPVFLLTRILAGKDVLAGPALNSFLMKWKLTADSERIFKFDYEEEDKMYGSLK